MHDYAYSFNDPLTEKYFWHPAYDNYPVVGVNWKQAKAFVFGEHNILTLISQRRKKLLQAISDYLLKQNGNGLHVVVIP